MVGPIPLIRGRAGDGDHLPSQAHIERVAQGVGGVGSGPEVVQAGGLEMDGVVGGGTQGGALGQQVDIGQGLQVRVATVAALYGVGEPTSQKKPPTAARPRQTAD